MVNFRITRLVLPVAVLVLAFSGCRRNDPLLSDSELEITEINAFYGDSKSKTALSEDGAVLWSPGDEINVFFNTTGLKFTALNTSPAKWTVFRSETSLIFGGTEGEQKPYLYGIYPYSENNEQVQDTLTLTVPNTQIATAGSFAPGAFPSVGKSSTTDMAFYNVCGGIRFSLVQEGVMGVLFKGNDGENLAGKVKLTFDSDGHPAVADVVRGDTLLVTSTGEPGEYLQPGTWYYLSMLPCQLKKGFSIKLYRDDDKEAVLNVNSAHEIKRSVFGSLANLDSKLVYRDGISDLKLNETSLKVLPGQKIQLSYTLIPENAVYDWIKWESSNENVATVDADGLVTVVGSGSCYILVRSDNGSGAVCNITTEFDFTVSPSELTFAAQDSLSKTVSVLSPYDWTVKDAPEWVSFDVNGKDATKESIAASTSPVMMTVTVQKNASIARDYIVVIEGGSAAANLYLNQKSFSKGTGTKEDPFNVCAAVAKAVEIGSAAPSTEYYYIDGYITEVKEINTTYGNASFYIGDDACQQQNRLYCFRVKYIGGTDFTSEDQIKAGDKVVMYAQLYNFKGNTPETSGSGASQIYTHNGKGDSDPYTAETKTVEEFITLADPYTYYKLDGTVSAFNSFYCTFTLTDATGSISVYKVTEESCKKYASLLHNGFHVTLSGKYNNYLGAIEVTDAVILNYVEAPYLDVTPEIISAPATASIQTISVFSNVSWTAQCDNPEFTLDVTGSVKGDGTVSISCPENNDIHAREVNIVISTDNEDVATKSYKVTLTQEAAEDPDAKFVELTNEEIVTTLTGIGSTSVVYTDVTYKGVSGEWTARSSALNTNKWIQIRDTQASYLKSPVFSSKINKIVIRTDAAKSATMISTFYAIPSSTQLPSSSLSYADEANRAVLEDAYGKVQTLGLPDVAGVAGEIGESVTINVTGDTNDFMLLVTCEGGAATKRTAYINSIRVYFKD